MEEEDEGELSDEPTDEPTDGPMDETAVKLTEGHPPDDDELTEDHPPSNELAKGHPPDYEQVETITVECPTSRWELPPGGTWEEGRVVIHVCEDEMDRFCLGPVDAGTVENQEEEVQAAMGGCCKVNCREMYPEKLNDII